MSNRSLFEFNHDYVEEIRKNPAGFVADLEAYLNSGSPRTAAVLKDRYHINHFGMRHHSDGFDIQWGGSKAAYTPVR